MEMQVPVDANVHPEEDEEYPSNNRGVREKSLKKQNFFGRVFGCAKLMIYWLSRIVLFQPTNVNSKQLFNCVTIIGKEQLFYVLLFFSHWGQL